MLPTTSRRRFPLYAMLVLLSGIAAPARADDDWKQAVGGYEITASSVGMMAVRTADHATVFSAGVEWERLQPEIRATLVALAKKTPCRDATKCHFTATLEFLPQGAIGPMLMLQRSLDYYTPAGITDAGSGQLLTLDLAHAAAPVAATELVDAASLYAALAKHNAVKRTLGERAVAADLPGLLAQLAEPCPKCSLHFGPDFAKNFNLEHYTDGKTRIVFNVGGAGYVFVRGQVAVRADRASWFDAGLKAGTFGPRFEAALASRPFVRFELKLTRAELLGPTSAP